MMLKMGFDNNCIDMVMRCVTTVSYTVTINRCWSFLFKPGRGLRQGDILSPFLFLIYSERLSSILQLNVNNGLLKGIKASRNGPLISHLLFVDENILFG